MVHGPVDNGNNQPPGLSLEGARHPHVTPHGIAPVQRHSHVRAQIQIPAKLGPQARPHARKAPVSVLPGPRSTPPSAGVVEESKELNLHRMALSERYSERWGTQFRREHIAMIGQKFPFFKPTHRRMPAQAELLGGQECPTGQLQLATRPQGPGTGKAPHPHRLGPPVKIAGLRSRPETLEVLVRIEPRQAPWTCNQGCTQL